MRNTRLAGQALSLATAESARSPYVCRACLSQTGNTRRQLSTSPPLCASSEPFYKRIQNTIFGNNESRAAEAHREAARKKHLEEIRSSDSGKSERETVELHNGVVYEVAEMVDPITHEDYVASRTWKGMGRVGGEEWVRGRADTGEMYTGFMPAKQVKLEGEDWTVLLHTITAEVLSLRNAGRDVLQVCNARYFDGENRGATRGVIVSDHGGSLVLSADTQEKAILARISETSQEERDPEALKAELEEALASEGGRLFMALKLDDPRIKLAILKRTMQLTGKRIPDILLSNATNLEHLHSAFATKEVPKKLHETTQLQMLGETPNIQVHESRRTHVHRDKQIGRWKVIEHEMNLRNMPMRGVGNVAARGA